LSSEKYLNKLKTLDKFKIILYTTNAMPNIGISKKRKGGTFKMKKSIVRTTWVIISLILAMFLITSCEGVTPSQDPFIEVISPREGDVIDGKDSYINVEWTSGNLRVDDVYIDFACVYNGAQVGDWERIGLDVPASDGCFTFGPDIASWIIRVFEVVPDICQIRVMEAVGVNPGFEWVYDYSGTFVVTTDD